MARTFPGVEWNLADTDGNVGTWERVGIAVLMDIRHELLKLNGLLGCPNFTAIPKTLREIKRNTTKKRKKKP